MGPLLYYRAYSIIRRVNINEAEARYSHSHIYYKIDNIVIIIFAIHAVYSHLC